MVCRASSRVLPPPSLPLFSCVSHTGRERADSAILTPTPLVRPCPTFESVHRIYRVAPPLLLPQPQSAYLGPPSLPPHLRRADGGDHFVVSRKGGESWVGERPCVVWYTLPTKRTPPPASAERSFSFSGRKRGGDRFTVLTMMSGWVGRVGGGRHIVGAMANQLDRASRWLRKNSGERPSA